MSLYEDMVETFVTTLKNTNGIFLGIQNYPILNVVATINNIDFSNAKIIQTSWTDIDKEYTVFLIFNTTGVVKSFDIFNRMGKDMFIFFMDNIFIQDNDKLTTKKLYYAIEEFLRYIKHIPKDPYYSKDILNAKAHSVITFKILDGLGRNYTTCEDSLFTNYKYKDFIRDHSLYELLELGLVYKYSD